MENDLLFVDGVRLTRAELTAIVDVEAQALLDEGWRPYDVMDAPGSEFADIIRAFAALAIGLQLHFDTADHTPTGEPFPLTLAEAYQAEGGIPGCPRYMGWLGSDMFASKLPATAWLRLLRQLGDLPRSELPVPDAWQPGAPPIRGRALRYVYDDVYTTPMRIGDEVTWMVGESVDGHLIRSIYYTDAPTRSIRLRILQLFDVVDQDAAAKRWRPIKFLPYAGLAGAEVADVEVLELR